MISFIKVNKYNAPSMEDYEMYSNFQVDLNGQLKEEYIDKVDDYSLASIVVSNLTFPIVEVFRNENIYNNLKIITSRCDDLQSTAKEGEEYFLEYDDKCFTFSFFNG